MSVFTTIIAFILTSSLILHFTAIHVHYLELYGSCKVCIDSNLQECKRQKNMPLLESTAYCLSLEHSVQLSL